MVESLTIRTDQFIPLHTCVITEPLRTKQHALSDMRRRKQSQDILGLGRA